MEVDRHVILHYLYLIQSSKICWRNGGEDKINLRETLNYLEGAGGMEEDKHVIIHYFDLIQSSKICQRNGGRGTE